MSGALEDLPWNDRELLELAKKSSSGRWLMGKLCTDPELLSKFADSPDFSFTRAAVARNSHTPVSVLIALLATSDEEVRKAATSNPKAPLEELKLLAQDPIEDIRSEVAKNQSTPVSVLENLSSDGSEMVRVAVASNPNCPASVLEILSADSGKLIRREVAGNVRTPVPVLLTLARDEESLVRDFVAKNPESPSEVLEALAREEEKSVRLWAARNPSMPVASLEQLALDTERAVRGAIAENPMPPRDLLEKLARDKDGWVRTRVACNPLTPVQIQAELAQDPLYTVRMSVADHPKLPAEWFQTLSNDKSYAVRELLAMNEACPEKILTALAGDPYSMVREAVAGNRNTPASALRQVLKTLAADESPEDPSGARAQKVGITDLESLAPMWRIDFEIWCDLSEESREKLILADPAGLLNFWRRYFETWSTQDLGDEEEAFTPIALAIKLGIEGAEDLLELVEKFELSDRVADTRDSFEELVDELVDWITSNIPVRPDGFGLYPGDFFIENNPENRSKLEAIDPHHVWHEYWGDVPYLVAGFNSTSDPFKVPGYYVTDQPHVGEDDYVGSLQLRVTCLLCDGEGESEAGEGCPACEEGREIVVSGEAIAFKRALALLPQSLRTMMS